MCFFPAASSLLPDFTEFKWVRALLWIGLWLKKILCLVWSSIQTTITFSISELRLFDFIITHVFTGVALLQFPSQTFPLHSQICLYVWYKRPNFLPISALDMPSSMSLVFLLFYLKWEKWDSSFEHLKGHCRVINWPNSSIIVFQGIERAQGEKERRNGQLVELSEHT